MIRATGPMPAMLDFQRQAAIAVTEARKRVHELEVELGSARDAMWKIVDTIRPEGLSIATGAPPRDA
jgi:biotin operon repressor